MLLAVLLLHPNWAVRSSGRSTASGANRHWRARRIWSTATSWRLQDDFADPEL